MATNKSKITDMMFDGIDFDHLPTPHDLGSKASMLERKINARIETIWRKVKEADPKLLLMLSSDMEKMGGIKSYGDIAIAAPSEFPSRPTEYIQSIVASSEECHQNALNSEDNEPLCMEIIGHIEELTMLTYAYLFCWGCTLDETIRDRDIQKLIVEAQGMYLVRGNRYQVFQESFYKPLLLPHDEEFRKLFGVGAIDVLNGLMALEYALSQGRIEGINVLGAFFDQFAQGGFPDPNNMPPSQADAISDALFETFSVDHYDVSRITGWPEKLIEALAYKPGEARWFEQGRYKNWPIVSLPIKERPFIMLSGKYYCFDYYSLMDNFYRIVRRTLIRLDPAYEQTWQTKQKEASEDLVASIFSKLLPGCDCHASNHFSIDGKKGHLVENDLLIRYCDALIIVEVKAGSFTYAPPITDWDKHVRDFKSLIEKADHQCAKMREYLNRFEGEVPLYDSYGHEKGQVDLSCVTDIFEISVTIDDINAFASKAERLSFLALEAGAISISINDLMVYGDYFENPFEFIHFLKQRRQASRNRKLAFNDELDHLGMYIERNCYAFTGPENESYDEIFVTDYRDDINSYYSDARMHGIDIPKPHQDLPRLYSELLRSCAMDKMSNPVQFSSFMLDLSSSARTGLSSQIEALLPCARSRNAPQVINLCGKASDTLSARLTCFIEAKEGSRGIDVGECREYTLSMMMANNERNRNMLLLSFDEKGALIDICFEHLKPMTLAAEEAERLRSIGAKRAQRFVDEHKALNGKIGRNEPCPCGSGLKYKKCHGR